MHCSKIVFAVVTVSAGSCVGVERSREVYGKRSRSRDVRSSPNSFHLSAVIDSVSHRMRTGVLGTAGGTDWWCGGRERSRGRWSECRSASTEGRGKDRSVASVGSFVIARSNTDSPRVPAPAMVLKLLRTVRDWSDRREENLLAVEVGGAMLCCKPLSQSVCLRLKSPTNSTGISMSVAALIEFSSLSMQDEEGEGWRYTTPSRKGERCGRRSSIHRMAELSVGSVGSEREGRVGVAAATDSCTSAAIPPE